MLFTWKDKVRIVSAAVFVALGAVTICAGPALARHRRHQAGTAYAYGEVCTAAHEGQRITTEGYLAPLNRTTCYADGCRLDFVNVASAQDPALLRQMMVAIPVGNDEDQMARLPTRFSDEDVVIHTAEGDIGIAKRVRISATVQSVAPAGGYEAKSGEMNKPYCQLTELHFQPL